jgi:serine protease Do
VIRKTLNSTKCATYSVDLPDQQNNGMPTARGTGFFVSADGWFVTAAHVITQNGSSDGPVRTDIENGWLMKERRPGNFIEGMCQGPKLEYVDPVTDFALLKVDFSLNADKDHLKGKTGFPFIEISSRILEEGEPVYSFGYPLSETNVLVNNAVSTFALTAHCPRVTSAIVAATMEKTTLASSPDDPKVYVLDKALNYGNSGGPIVATETGKVHAICSRFQPVFVPQEHLIDAQGNFLHVMIPSLYSIVSSLSSDRILSQLRKRGIPISEL